MQACAEGPIGRFAALGTQPCGAGHRATQRGAFAYLAVRS